MLQFYANDNMSSWFHPNHGNSRKTEKIDFSMNNIRPLSMKIQTAHYLYLKKRKNPKNVSMNKNNLINHKSPSVCMYVYVLHQNGTENQNQNTQPLFSEFKECHLSESL